jgi:predicted NAD/FAD-dependent oxidoreductase
MSNSYDVVILGMGPAGLAAASTLRASGLKLAMVDAGKSVGKRDRYDANNATQGDGGAGLFSDGKFSFFSSATGLWSLPRHLDLRTAYYLDMLRSGRSWLGYSAFP